MTTIDTETTVAGLRVDERLRNAVPGVWRESMFDLTTPDGGTVRAHALSDCVAVGATRTLTWGQHPERSDIADAVMYLTDDQAFALRDQIDAALALREKAES